MPGVQPGDMFADEDILQAALEDMFADEVRCISCYFDTSIFFSANLPPKKLLCPSVRFSLQGRFFNSLQGRANPEVDGVP